MSRFSECDYSFSNCLLLPTESSINQRALTPTSLYVTLHRNHYELNLSENALHSMGRLEYTPHISRHLLTITSLKHHTHGSRQIPCTRRTHHPPHLSGLSVDYHGETFRPVDPDGQCQFNVRGSARPGDKRHVGRRSGTARRKKVFQ